MLLDGRTRRAALTGAVLACAVSAPRAQAQDDAAATLDGSGLRRGPLVALPNLVAGGKFSYDIGAVDERTRSYYLADRTNASLDIVDLETLAVRQARGFAGVGASNDVSGPDGVVPTPDGVFVGDVDAVRVVDPVAAAIVATIPIATSGFRTDEGCFDPEHHLAMFQNPADSPPFATFVATRDRTIVASLPFDGSSGLDACLYDPERHEFFVNNDGTSDNPNGEIDVIPAWSVLAGRPAVVARYPLGDCGPSGITMGRRGELLVACDAPAGDPQITLLVSARTGAILRTVTQVGGSDEAAFDPRHERFYVAARDMTADGISQTGASGATFTPVLGVIDAASGAWIANIPTGAGAHSVAVDPTTGRVFVPVPPTATSAGGVQIFTPARHPRD